MTERNECNYMQSCRLLRYAKNTGVRSQRTVTAEGNADLATVRNKIRCNYVDEETKQVVLELYEADDVSRLTADKKDVVTRNKERKQKRLLTDTLTNLLEKYCADSTIILLATWRSLVLNLFVRSISNGGEK